MRTWKRSRGYTVLQASNTILPIFPVRSFSRAESLRTETASLWPDFCDSARKLFSFAIDIGEPRLGANSRWSNYIQRADVMRKSTESQT